MGFNVQNVDNCGAWLYGVIGSEMLFL